MIRQKHLINTKKNVGKMVDSVIIGPWSVENLKVRGGFQLRNQIDSSALLLLITLEVQ